MRKKILSLLLCLVLSVSIFTGCTLVKFNQERDAQSVIAVVNSTQINGKNEQQKFMTKERKIYKADLFSFINQNTSYIEQEIHKGTTHQQIVEDIIDDQLVMNQLILNEADARIYFGDIYTGQVYDSETNKYVVKTYTDNKVDKLGLGLENQIKKSIYDFIDQQIAVHRDDILKEHDMDIPSEPQTQEKEEAKYPVKPQENTAYLDMSKDELTKECEARGISYNKNADKVQLIAILQRADEIDANVYKDDDANREPAQKGVWMPSPSRYPGLTTNNEEEKSLYRQAIERFITSLHDVVEQDFRLSIQEKANIKVSFAEIEQTINTKGILYVYGMIGDTYLMQQLIGNDYRNQIKVQLLQEYLNYSTITLSSEEIQSHYNSELHTQMLDYKNIATYDKDIMDGKKTILYHPEERFFYVKQILVPFSDAQVKELKDAKENKSITSIENGYETYRQQLANGIMSYEHKDGNDFGKPKSVYDIYNDIKTQMATYGSDSKEADREFDNLIYKYNTDPGIFDKPLGYAVRTKLDEGETESYVTEFGEGARELYNNGKVGDISGMIVTDFGVHILYLSKKITAGETILMTDYESNGKHNTIRDKMFIEAFDNKISKSFDMWKKENLDSYQKKDGVIVKYPKTYDDVLKV